MADAGGVARAAAATREAFGHADVLCNNAGVAAGGGIDSISLDNGCWVMDVNLTGVVHGIKAFLPQMHADCEGGRIVNGALLAGMNDGLGFSPYVASKFAVVGLSPARLWVEFKGDGIGVSLLCPRFVWTRIGESGRKNRGRSMA